MDFLIKKILEQYSLEECQDYLNEYFNGYGRIVGYYSSKTLQSCKCPFFAHDEKSIVYLKFR